MSLVGFIEVSMPIDWSEVQNTTGGVPDASIIRGTKVLDMPPVSAPSVGADIVGNLPTVPAIDTVDTTDTLPYKPDYSFFEGIGAGLQDTALNAMWHAYDDPDFDYDSTFSPQEALQYLEKTQGYEVSDDERNSLLKTGSKSEFDFQLQRITSNKLNNEIASQEMTGYVLGSMLDADLVIGGAVGRVRSVAKMGELARMGVQGAAVGAASVGGYGLDKYTPLTQAEIAFQVAAVTAASLLLPKIKPKEPPPLVVTKGTK